MSNLIIIMAEIEIIIDDLISLKKNPNNLRLDEIILELKDVLRQVEEEHRSLS